MNTCPNCGQHLSRKQNEFGVYWGCNDCGGYAVSMAILRKVIREDCVIQAWAAARERGPGERDCPMCDRAMTEVPVEAGEEALRLDVCKTCQFFWFDPAEFESLPAPRPGGALRERRLPQAAREAIAIEEVRMMSERAKAQDLSPDEAWKIVPAIFGFPVEVNTNPLSCRPVATWILAALIAVVSLSAFGELRGAIAQYGLIPAEVFRKEGLTLISSFFLHGGVMHLIGNLYFLLIFGSNVEDCLGRWRFLALIVSATLAGDALHVMAQPDSIVASIGASGGISGLIAFYALRFPQTRLDFLLKGWWQVPAWAAFILWLLQQGLSAFMQLAGFSHVAGLAHLGGAAIGFLFWIWYRLGPSPETK
jgi:membrane associated rhomboid family serine protease